MACHTPAGNYISQRFLYLFFFSENAIGSFNQTSQKDVWLAGMERVFQIIDFLSWLSRGLKRAPFMDLVDLWLLTALTWAVWTHVPRGLLSRCADLSDDRRTDRQNTTKKSVDWEWMTSVDLKRVKWSVSYLKNRPNLNLKHSRSMTNIFERCRDAVFNVSRRV